MADEGAAEALARVLEVHQIEYVDREVGYVCGCDEDGVLDPMFTLRDALTHQASAALEGSAEVGAVVAEVPFPEPDVFPDGPPSGHSHSFSRALVVAYGEQQHRAGVLLGIEHARLVREAVAPHVLLLLRKPGIVAGRVDGDGKGQA